MADTVDQKLRDAVREQFGRELTDAELQRLSRALPGVVAVACRLSWWQSRLGETAPAMSFALAPMMPRHDG